jgi:hypothetical protein
MLEEFLNYLDKKIKLMLIKLKLLLDSAAG